MNNNGLSILANEVYYTANTDKTTVLNNLEINEFYDDSCLRIRELYKKTEDHKLPHLNKLYLVYPEDKIWVNVHENTKAKKDCKITI